MAASRTSTTGPQASELAEQLAAAERRASTAEQRAELLEAELARVREWRRTALLPLVAVALVAVVMLGIVGYTAADQGSSIEFPLDFRP